MKETNEYQQTTNACEESEGIFHRWEVWKWAEPLYTSLPVAELESGKFLPKAYGSVVFKCKCCGVTHWEDIIMHIDYTPTFEYRQEEEKVDTHPWGIPIRYIQDACDTE